MRSEARQLGLCLEPGQAAPETPGIRLGEWLWRLPAAIGSEHLLGWLQRWQVHALHDRQPRWLTLVGQGRVDPQLLYRLRACAMPALVLRPQPGTALAPLTEQALRSGKSDIVIAPMPVEDSQAWLLRFEQAAARGGTHALLL